MFLSQLPQNKLKPSSPWRKRQSRQINVAPIANPDWNFAFLWFNFFWEKRRVTTYQVDKAAQWGLALPAQNTQSKREDHKICKIDVRLHSKVCFCMVKSWYCYLQWCFLRPNQNWVWQPMHWETTWYRKFIFWSSEFEPSNCCTSNVMSLYEISPNSQVKSLIYLYYTKRKLLLHSSYGTQMWIISSSTDTVTTARGECSSGAGHCWRVWRTLEWFFFQYS